jgi:hypothetical protein
MLLICNGEASDRSGVRGIQGVRVFTQLCALM